MSDLFVIFFFSRKRVFPVPLFFYLNGPLGVKLTAAVADVNTILSFRPHFVFLTLTLKLRPGNNRAHHVMKMQFNPLKYAYDIIFPDAGRYAHDRGRFALFTVLLLGLMLSGAALGAAGWP